MVAVWLTGCLALLLSVAVQAGAEGEDPLIRDDGRTRGTLQAPITLIEYSDFTCGFCMKFFRETWPRLQAKYVDTGKLRFLYRDYPRANRGPGLDAAIAARCAGEQGQYWSMHDRLFSTGGRLDQTAFERHAKAMGLAQTAFSKCLQEARYTKAIFQDREQGMSLGFRGTPGFVLLRTEGDPKDPALVIPGALPYEVFEEEIDRLLAAPATKEKG
jgi:protein-disulfide isomerase